MLEAMNLSKSYNGVAFGRLGRTVSTRGGAREVEFAPRHTF